MTQAFFRSAGSPHNPAIVLLHGGGLSSRQWMPQLDSLAGDFFVLAPDLPEQGRTPGPFTLAGAVNQVRDLIHDQVIGGRAHVVGLSLGGAVALELLRTAPEVAASALVTGTSGTLSPLLGQVTVWSAKLMPLLPRAWMLNAAVRQFGLEGQRDLVEEDLARGLDAGFNRRMAQALMAHRPPDAAPVPTLILVGTQETGPAKAAARTLARTIAGARACTVEGVGHVWNLQDPALFDATLRAWIGGTPLPPRLHPLA